MQRAATIFALAAACLLLFGILLQRFTAGRYGMSLALPKHSYAFDYQAPCFALAALFALFAFLYALSLPRLSDTTAQWHLWLTVGGVLLAAAAYGTFAVLVGKEPQRPTQTVLLFPAVGMIFGPVLFAAAQILFIAAAVREKVSITTLLRPETERP